MSAADTMLELQNVTVGYGRKVLIADANAKICRGEMVSLIGANGAGKSSLLRTLSGELSTQKGTVKVAGANLPTLNRAQLARCISLVNTQRIEVEALSAREVVAMGRYPYTGYFGRLTKSDFSIVDEAMEATGTISLSQRNIATLSDGERQKVMIARALAQQTPIMLLDEPTAFLDVASRVEVLTLLQRLAHRNGKSIMLSLHDVPSALELSDWVWLLPGNGTMLVDTPTNLIAANKQQTPGNALDALFAGRSVRFDSSRLDYVSNL
jgi:iron complex transport system ATP-binding protein